MGRAITMSTNPLLDAAEDPVTVVMPEFPWDVVLASSDGVAAALADASRAIGRLEGARERVSPWHQCAYALASLEGWACVLAAGRKVSWRAVDRAFADSTLAYRRGATDAETAARLIGFHSGLDGYADRFRSTGIVASELSAGEFVSPRFQSTLERGLDTWLVEGPGSGLVRSILAMMSIAASMPESERVAMAARSIFPWLVVTSRASETMIPISAGFVGFAGDWDLISRALNDPDGYDPDTVNRAVELSLRAVERAASAASYEVMSLGSRHRRDPIAIFLSGTIPSVRYIFYLLNALPCATREQLLALTSLSLRTVNKAVRILEGEGAVVVDGQVRGRQDYVVRCSPPWRPSPHAAQYYQSVSAEPLGQR